MKSVRINSYFLQRLTTKVIKSGRDGWAGCFSCVGERCIQGFGGKNLKEGDRGVVLDTYEGIILKLLLNSFGGYELASSGLAQGQWRAVVTIVMILQVPEIHGTFYKLKDYWLVQDSVPLRHVISYVVSHQSACLSVLSLLLSLNRQQNVKLVPSCTAIRHDAKYSNIKIFLSIQHLKLVTSV